VVKAMKKIPWGKKFPVFLYCITFLLNINITATDKNSLVAYWPMDEGHGKIIFDSSKNKNNGIIYGDAEWVDGKSGKGLRFNGQNSYVKVPDSKSLNIKKTLTIETWVKFRAIDRSSFPTIIAKGIAESSMIYWLSYNAKYAYWSFCLGNGYNSNCFAYYLEAPDNNIWYHLAIVFDKGFYKFYLNGILEMADYTGIADIATEKYPLYIGAYSSNMHFLNGTLDEVKIYEWALSETEIKADATMDIIQIKQTGE